MTFTLPVNASPFEVPNNPDSDDANRDPIATIYANQRIVPVTYYVNGATGNDANTGTSWAEAFATLTQALSVADGDDKIWIAGGTYYPDEGPGVTDNDPTASFTVTGDQDGLKIYGGFAGTEMNLSERTPGHETILSGDITQDDAPFAPLTDSDGDASTATQTDHINGTNSHHVIFVDGGSDTLFGADVAANVTTATRLDGITITAGDATGATFALGGGLLCDGRGSGNECSPRLHGVVFAGNRAYVGGGLFLDGLTDGNSSAALTNALVIGNEAVGGLSLGGAMAAQGKGTPRITNSTIVQNRASEQGGAMIFLADSRGYNPEVTNTIVRKNTAPDGPQIYNDGSVILTITHTLIEGGLAGISENNGSSTTDGGNTLDADPQFADASDPMGADGMFGTADDGLQLTSGSPALDAGTPDLTGLGLSSVDLTFGERVRDNDGDSTNDPVIDLGAYEAPDGVVLPVELAGLSARRTGEGVTLEWQTLTETGNDRFDIERRIEGTANSGWAQIGTVEGAGTTTTTQRYVFNDMQLPYDAEALSYRLKQVDVDGTTAYSKEMQVRPADAGALELLGTYPNPAQNQATVRFAVPASATAASLTLYDLLGREVKTMNLSGTQGQHTRALRLDTVAPGVYFLRLSADGRTRTQKVTVVR